MVGADHIDLEFTLQPFLALTNLVIDDEGVDPSFLKIPLFPKSGPRMQSKSLKNGQKTLLDTKFLKNRKTGQKPLKKDFHKKKAARDAAAKKITHFWPEISKKEKKLRLKIKKL